MADIKKIDSNNSNYQSKTLEELKAKFNEIGENIKLILSKRNLQEEDKRELRVLYLKFSSAAKDVAQRTSDEKESKEYLEMSEKASAKAQLYGSKISAKHSTRTFEDVKGLENVKTLVKSFVFMAEHPELLKHYKIEGGLGMLMYGAPGTGKTMFAEAVANKLGLPLYVITPADLFNSHVGESEKSVRDLFDEIDISENGAVLFIDECESIFSKRKEDTQDYKAAVTTELLQRINGFGVDGSKRIMIAATNRPQDIDPAYLRYKRFSHLVHVTPPDSEAKRAIIESKLKGIELSDITIDEILEMSEPKRIVGGVEVIDSYYSGADISGIMEEAARLALEIIEQNGLSQPIPLTREMFERAFKKTPPSISEKDLDMYNHFRENIDK